MEEAPRSVFISPLLSEDQFNRLKESITEIGPIESASRLFFSKKTKVYYAFVTMATNKLASEVISFLNITRANDPNLPGAKWTKNDLTTFWVPTKVFVGNIEPKGKGFRDDALYESSELSDKELVIAMAKEHGAVLKCSPFLKNTRRQFDYCFITMDNFQAAMRLISSIGEIQSSYDVGYTDSMYRIDIPTLYATLARHN